MAPRQLGSQLIIDRISKFISLTLKCPIREMIIKYLFLYIYSFISYLWSSVTYFLPNSLKMLENVPVHVAVGRECSPSQ